LIFAKQRGVIIALCVVLILAAAARFYNLKNCGISEWDSGMHLNGARSYCAAASYFYKKLLHEPVSSFGEYMVKNGGGYPYSTKPLFYPMAAVFLSVFGEHDYSLLFLSAIAGILSVFMLYLIGKEIFNPYAGVVSALMLALSPYHIHYSKSGLSISASILFILLAVYFYIKSLKPAKRPVFYMGLAGFCLSGAFGCHYNLFWFAPFFLFIDAADYLLNRRETGVGGEISRLAAFIGAFMLLFLIYALPFEIAGYLTKDLISRHAGVPYHIEGYFEQFKWNTSQVGGINFSLDNSVYYIRLLKIVENPVMLLLAIAGIFILINRMRKKIVTVEALVLFLCVFPMLLWSFYVYRAGRAIAVLIPFFILSAALTVERLTDIINKPKAGKIVLYALFILMISAGLYKSLPAINEYSGYKSAVDFMAKQGSVKHISNMPPISVFYAGPDNTNVNSAVSPQEVRRFYNEGFKYFLHSNSRNDDLYRRQSLYDNIARMRARPVFIAYSSPYSALFESAVIESRENRIKSSVIEVYSLKDILD
jgi:4-amino-4-deoxy-L-arabinose transferase-like glycosyltransferase